MKNILTTSLFALSLAASTMFASGAAHADGVAGFTLPGTAYGAVDLGTGMQESDFNKRSDATVYDVRYGRAFSWYRVEGELLRDETTGSGHVGNVALNAFNVNGYVDWKNTSHFEPYVTAGIGVADFSGRGVEHGSKGTEPLYNAGVGVRYWVSNNSALDLRYRHFWSSADVRNDDCDPQAFTQDAVTLGFNFAL